MKLTPYLISVTFAIASGCTPYSESFDCPPGQGVGCKSLNVINQMVEEGKLPLESVPLERVPLERGAFKEGLIEARNNHAPLSLVKASPPATLSKETLSTEPHMKVWMAAYEEAPGIIHEPAVIYLALKKNLHVPEIDKP